MIRPRPSSNPFPRWSPLAVVLLASPAHAAEGGGGGLEIIPDPVMLLLLVALFVALVFVVNAAVVKPLLAVLDAREARIEGSQRKADQVAGEAERVLGDYEREVRDAREGAERDRREALDLVRREHTQTTNAARSGAEDRIGRAREEVAQALEEARTNLRGEAELLAREAAVRILGRELA